MNGSSVGSLPALSGRGLNRPDPGGYAEIVGCAKKKPGLPNGTELLVTLDWAVSVEICGAILSNAPKPKE
jgi:hypothetical protein